MGYLDGFYADRKVPYDRQLALTGNRSIRLQSHGASGLETAEPSEQQNKLPEYQKEMQSFGTYLKEKFLG